MGIGLYKHQLGALNKLKPGSILCGGVGSGKSRVALAYYFLEIGKGRLRINGRGTDAKMKKQVPLYIITTARKRDTFEWDKELAYFLLCTEQYPNLNIVVDSWNNIGKYEDVTDAFFIFDEQRVVGYGAWGKSFIKISKRNRWILLSATPGDTWMDYLCVFIANGFYRNKTDFCRRHVIYSRFSKYPKIDKYINTDILERHRDDILVTMQFERKAILHKEYVYSTYDHAIMKKVFMERWDPYSNSPITDAGKWVLLQRQVVNSDRSRLDAVGKIMAKHPKAVIFYNFNYELDALKTYLATVGIPYTEYNGHKHEPILAERKTWAYLVQYTAGAEGWNCVLTDTTIFYSQNYSYKIMEQASGRINRLNTPYKDLYYFYITSKSKIDSAITKALENKKTFNESAYAVSFGDKNV